MNIEYLFQNALRLHQSGSIQEARDLYLKILSFNSNHFDSLHLLGLISFQLGDYYSAIDLIAKALTIFERSELAHCSIANAYSSLGKFDLALAHYNSAISIKFDHFEAHFNKAIALKELGYIEESLKSYKFSMILKPDFAQCHSNIGALLTDIGEFSVAILFFNRAILIEPGSHVWYSNRGVAFKNLGQTSNALKDYETAVVIKPDYTECYSNRGVALQELKRVKEAYFNFHNALILNFRDPESHFNLSLLLLLTGDFNGGLPEYEWRWNSPSNSCFKIKREFIQPLWLGQFSLVGKTIFIHSEQGLGDTIQFVRYIYLLSEMGASVIFEVQRELVNLLRQIFINILIIAKEDVISDFDCHCPLMSLPLAFKTNLDTIPFPFAYLKCESNKMNFWLSRLGVRRIPRVGLVWTGNVGHVNDRQRSLNLSILLSYLPKGFEYISLQKEVRKSDQIVLNNSFIKHLGDEINDFTDTAALCQLMDIVISVDTSVAHLSSAMGKPTWILLPFSPDWRWLLNREDSPWYQSVKLFRQSQMGDWTQILETLSQELTRISFDVKE